MWYFYTLFMVCPCQFFYKYVVKHNSKYSHYQTCLYLCLCLNYNREWTYFSDFTLWKLFTASTFSIYKYRTPAYSTYHFRRSCYHFRRSCYPSDAINCWIVEFLNRLLNSELKFSNLQILKLMHRHKPDHWSWRFCVSGCLLNRWIVSWTQNSKLITHYP